VKYPQVGGVITYTWALLVRIAEDEMFAAFVALSLTVPVANPTKEKDLPEAAQKDLKKLEGKWKAVKLVANEEEDTPTRDGADIFVTFKAHKVTIEGVNSFQITEIDPTTDPKVIDFKALEDKSGITKDTVYEAIYKLDGETLTIAVYIGAGNKRPQKFESPKDSSIMVITLKRTKE
jgi:uncharacterized protein (TIGR03067 family)